MSLKAYKLIPIKTLRIFAVVMGEPLQPLSCYRDSFERVKELGRGKFGIVYQVRGKGEHEGSTSYAAKYVR